MIAHIKISTIKYAYYAINNNLNNKFLYKYVHYLIKNIVLDYEVFCSIL